MKPRVKLSAKDGKLTLEAENVTGPFCKDMLAQVTQDLGAEADTEEPKPEFYELGHVSQQQEQQRLQE